MTNDFETCSMNTRNIKRQFKLDKTAERLYRTNKVKEQ